MRSATADDSRHLKDSSRLGFKSTMNIKIIFSNQHLLGAAEPAVEIKRFLN